MFLGYLDDSGRFEKKQSTYRVLTTVLLHDKIFSTVENIVGHCVQDLLPEEKWDAFEEFHAWQLYRGCEIFNDIDIEPRFKTITSF